MKHKPHDINSNSVCLLIPLSAGCGASVPVKLGCVNGAGWRYLCAWISLCVHIPSWSFIQLSSGSSGGWFPASIRGWGRSSAERGARTKRSPTLPLSWPRPHGGELRSITISNQATPPPPSCRDICLCSLRYDTHLLANPRYVDVN